MHFDSSPTWAKLQAMVQGLFGLLPNLVLALIVLASFALAARWGKRLIEGFSNQKGHHHNVGLVIGRLGSALTSPIVTDVTDFGINIRARWWTDANNTDYQAVKDQVIPAIWRNLTAHGIEMPYPTQQILLRAVEPKKNKGTPMPTQTTDGIHPHA